MPTMTINRDLNTKFGIKILICRNLIMNEPPKHKGLRRRKLISPKQFSPKEMNPKKIIIKHY